MTNVYAYFKREYVPKTRNKCHLEMKLNFTFLKTPTSRVFSVLVLSILISQLITENK